MSQRVSLKEHLEKLQHERDRFASERDRRYCEVALEREKALKIKDVADRDALQLAREIQTYKDTQANELREQINRERVLYTTKADLTAAVEKLEATIKPLVTYTTSQQGKSTGLSAWFGYICGAVGIVATVVAIAWKG